MFDVAIVIAAGMALGILTGLLPALPVFTGPFLLLFFGSQLTFDLLVIFWLIVVTGSQYFGSIACIATKIPGEESALIYINDLDQFTLRQRSDLLFSTAVGSTVGAILATAMIWLCVRWVDVLNWPFLHSYQFQAPLYAVILISFCWLDRRIWAVLSLIGIGLVLSPKNNFVLPESWLLVQEAFHGYTFYSLILGTLIIPMIVNYKKTSYSMSTSPIIAAKQNSTNWWSILHSTIVGIFSGLMPGPSASLASVAAYKITGDKKQKIVAAETANNSAVLSSAIPLMLLNLPFNQNTVIMSGIMDLRSMTMAESIMAPSAYFDWMLSIDFIVIVLMCSILLYFWLATHLIDIYVRFLEILHKNMQWILYAILTAMIVMDLFAANITLPRYLLLLGSFTILGLLLHKFRISAVPLLFAVLLGDQLIWAVIQFWYINF